MITKQELMLRIYDLEIQVEDLDNRLYELEHKK